MDSAKEIMERLGFKEEAKDSTKAAFVKNLIKQAYGIEVKVPVAYEEKNIERGVSEEEQLSFNFNAS